MGLYRQRGSRFWWFSFQLHGKRLHESTHSTDKALARAIYDKRRTEYLEGKYFDKKVEDRTTLAEMIKLYLDDHSKVNKRSYQTDVERTRTLLNYFGNKLLLELGPHPIEQYKAHRLLSVSKATVNRELATLKAVYNKAILWGKATSNPVKKVAMLEEDEPDLQVLTAAQKIALLEACPAFLKPIVLTALKTGMRAGEIRSLTWKDVDLERGTITVAKARAKSKRKRTIPLNSSLRQILEELPRISDNVFLGPNKLPLKKYGAIRTAWVTVAKKVGLEGLRFHDLRHQFASELVMKGFDLITVKDLLGHSSLRMVIRYAHLTADHKRLAVEALGDETIFMDA